MESGKAGPLAAGPLGTVVPKFSDVDPRHEHIFVCAAIFSRARYKVAFEQLRFIGICHDRR